MVQNSRSARGHKVKRSSVPPLSSRHPFPSPEAITVINDSVSFQRFSRTHFFNHSKSVLFVKLGIINSMSACSFINSINNYWVAITCLSSSSAQGWREQWDLCPQGTHTWSNVGEGILSTSNSGARGLQTHRRGSDDLCYTVLHSLDLNLQVMGKPVQV